MLLVADLCNDSDPGEVEIFSLVQEHIPLYRLRTDPLVNFTGYSNSDWGDKKVSGTEVTFNLTNEQISESLKYFCEYFNGVVLHCLCQSAMMCHHCLHRRLSFCFLSIL